MKNGNGRKIKISAVIVLSLFFLGSMAAGTALGSLLAETQNVINTEYFTEFNTALPTKITDINGELITEFTSDEKREIISYHDLPQLLVDALITREDRVFFSHPGFNAKAIIRALAGQLFHISLGGGSTLTQQIAGTLFCDRTEMSITRKIHELWWAIQMERRFTKNEILELYLNKIYFGGGTYGVSAASKYYFGHSAQEITPAEAALLVIQLSNPAFYNPFDHPERAMERQLTVLNSMVDAEYISRVDADLSYDEYWANFDFTRTSKSAYMMQDDKAPWFSEYVRRELSDLIRGSDDIYSSGFTVNTTLNLEHQYIAENVMKKWIDIGNKRYKAEKAQKRSLAYQTYIPFAELLAVMYNIPRLKVGHQRAIQRAKTNYVTNVNPVVDMFAMLTGQEPIKEVTNQGIKLLKDIDKQNIIEGTMVSIQNDTGFINALVGGSKYDKDNQFIRATQALLQPGSTFKPLYYSAAIDSKKFTPTTQISDTPIVFHTADGKPYIPQNFRGEWEGNVSVYYALIHSMNVPSLKILDGIGFDSAINRAIALLGIPDNEIDSRAFVPGYPIGLGVCSIHPIELARAFSIFASGGKEITPIAIRNIEKSNGDLYRDIEGEIMQAREAKGEGAQVISRQTAFVMTKMLEQTVSGGGTLQGQDEKFFYTESNGKKKKMPAAGKTGTTQNWADAWTCGFTPYYTAAFWFGFDSPGNSLGLNITGATLAGPAWGEFFGEIHRDLPYKDFPKPEDGVVQMKVCSVSGQLLSADCNEGTTIQWYLSGTQPTRVCPVHTNKTGQILGEERLKNEDIRSGQTWAEKITSGGLTTDLSFLDDDYDTTSGSKKNTNTNHQNYFFEDEDEIEEHDEEEEEDDDDDEDEDEDNYNFLME
ncbi:MAG: PBP1A family penicillin-binding protein [Treponema sp.]|nr:PBP1A family penicillin-binding protein [Treponema sp.]